MMMNKYIRIALGLICLTSCSEKEDMQEPNTGSFTIEVSMPQTSKTRVSVSPKDGSRDLIPKWEKGDLMKFYTYDNKGDHGSIRIFHLCTSPVENISEDGSTGRFSITYPADPKFDEWDDFSIIGISGKENTVEGREIKVEASAFRANIDNFKAPVWFVEKGVGTKSVVTSCKHFGVYEVLHVTNRSNLSISLRFKGYEAEKLWYREKATFLPITQYYSDQKEVYSIENTEAPVQFLLPGETAVFVSWYTPLDVKLKDVTLLVEIDGNKVRSTNKKSSDVTMKTGHAYHLYASWDGTHFSFDNGDPIITDEGELEDVPGYEL